MTLTSLLTSVAYLGDGVTTAFAVPFPFFEASELEVIERQIATGGETVRALDQHYRVAGGDGAGGTVTALTPPAASVQWHIRRRTARTQQIDYVENDPFPAATHERALDRAAARDQEQDEAIARTLQVPKTDPPTSLLLPGAAGRAGKFLAFDAFGNAVAMEAAPGGGAGGGGDATALVDLGEVGGSVALEGVASRAYRLALLDATCAVTLSAPADAAAPLRRLIVFAEYRQAAQRLVWPATVRWPDGIAPSGSYAPGTRDIFILLSDDGGATWLGGLAGSAYEV